MKLAIVGAGVIAQVHHIPAFKANGVEIVAVYDRKAEKAHRMADPLGAKVYTDLDEMLKDPEIDAVTICTRTDMHAPMAVKAVEAGKDVFLEKPMALNLAEAKKIKDAVEKNNVVFMIAMLNRFRTESQILTERRLSGRMGDIYHADCRWVRRRGVPANPWFSQKELSGGGPGIDIGVHAIDTSWYLMGCPEPISVSAVTHHRLGKVYVKGLEAYGSEKPVNGPMDVEDAAVALVRFEGGKSMTVTVSWAINGPDEDFNLKVYGTKEGASLNPFVIYSEENGYLMNITPKFVRDDAWDEGFENEVAHFVECVKERKEPISSARNCYNVQRIIEGIYESDRLGHEVQV